MPVPLMYEFGASGSDKVKREIRGIEAEAKASASRVDSANRRSFTSRGSDPSVRQTVRGFDQIGRAARAADAATIRARMSADRRAEAERINGIKREAREEVRAIENAYKARQRTAASVRTGAATTVGGSVKKILGVGANALALGGGLLGGLAAGGAIESEIEIRAAASRLANQVRQPEIKGDLAKEAKGVRGFSGMEAMGALEQFTNITGDLDTARQLLPDLGKLALATGTDLGELAATAGNAFIPLKDQISDPTERLRQMKDVMAALAGQGAVGAVEIKQLASYFAGLAATSNRFTGNKADLLKTMGAITQAARQRGGAADAAEAVTSTERFSSDVISKQKKLAALGVDVTAEGGTKLADPQEIITRILEKTGGKLGPIGDLFGERGIRAIQGFSPLFVEAEKKKKGGGRAAVAAEFKRLKGAQFSTEDIARGAQNRYSDEDIRLKEAQKAFNDAVGTKLLPVLTELIPKFTELLPRIADLSGVLADFANHVINNPIPDIGALIAGKIALDLAGAGLGAVIKQALTQGLGSLSALGAGGLVISAALATISIAALAGGSAAEELGRPSVDAVKARTELLRGDMSPEQMEERRKQLSGQLSNLQKEGPGAVATVFGGVSSVLGGKSAEEVRATSINELQKAINDFSKAIAASGDQFAATVASAQTTTNTRRTNPLIDR